MPGARRRARRCAYTEHGRRCRRSGFGEPPLCRLHLRVVEEIEEESPESPYDAIFGMVGDFFRSVMSEGEPWPDIMARGQEPRSRQPPPAAAPAPARNGELKARRIMNFGPRDRLSSALINQRRRELARIHHPDHGGATDAMQRVNEAADALLAIYR